ncbi:hypothetical protein KUCAC02_033973, partial [Chaenocephalus aceratus]
LAWQAYCRPLTSRSTASRSSHPATPFGRHDTFRGHGIPLGGFLYAAHRRFVKYKSWNPEIPERKGEEETSPESCEAKPRDNLRAHQPRSGFRVPLKQRSRDNVPTLPTKGSTPIFQPSPPGRTEP